MVVSTALYLDSFCEHTKGDTREYRRRLPQPVWVAHFPASFLSPRSPMVGIDIACVRTLRREYSLPQGCFHRTSGSPKKSQRRGGLRRIDATVRGGFGSQAFSGHSLTLAAMQALRQSQPSSLTCFAPAEGSPVVFASLRRSCGVGVAPPHTPGLVRTAYVNLQLSLF